jgi:iron complex outermembrane recepter protein
MVNLTGDGNYYVGDVGLLAETAHTISASVNWHDGAKAERGVSVTPYYTYVQNYIDVRRCPSSVCGSSAAVTASAKATTGFVYLQFANQSSELYGVDVAAQSQLARLNRYGTLTATGTFSVVRGRYHGGAGNLYNMMPANSRLAVVHALGRWRNVVELQLVGGKQHLSSVRNELPTDGYGLVALRTSCRWKTVRVDIGVDNLLNTFYTPPLGGAYVGQGATMSGSAIPWGIPIPGARRALSANVALMFRSK